MFISIKLQKRVTGKTELSVHEIIIVISGLPVPGLLLAPIIVRCSFKKFRKLLFLCPGQEIQRFTEYY